MNTVRDSSPAPFDTDGGVFVCRHQTQSRRNKWTLYLIASLLAFSTLMALLILLWSELPWWGLALAAIPSIVAALLALVSLKEVRRRLGIHLEGFRIARGRVEAGSLLAEFKEPTAITPDNPRDLVLIEWTPAKKQPESPVSIKWHLTSWDNPSQTDGGEWRVDDLSMRAEKPPFFSCYVFNNADEYSVLIREKLGVFSTDIRAPIGTRLMRQLRAAAALFRDFPVTGEATLEFQVKAPSGNKAIAAAFGAVGLLASAVSDEKKKNGVQEQLRAGKFLGERLDEEFFSIVHDLHARLSVG